jgi:hypothetical protein
LGMLQHQIVGCAAEAFKRFLSKGVKDS